jgi:hypothetical protein
MRELICYLPKTARKVKSYQELLEPTGKAALTGRGGRDKRERKKTGNAALAPFPLPPGETPSCSVG